MMPAWAAGEQAGTAGAGTPDSVAAASVPAHLPLSFTPNEGQAGPGVVFTCRAAEYTALFGKGRVAYLVPSAGGRHVIIERFPGVDPGAAPAGLYPLDMRESYFTGPASSWQTGIIPSGAISYEDLFAGIDLVFRGTNGSLKREFVVRPGADPAAIRTVYDGAERVRVAADGALVVRAGSGEFRESPPACYQEKGGVRVPVPCRFDVREDGSVSFVTGLYDPDLALVIDPALAYCGFIGGYGDDWGNAVAVDASGNVYIAGDTYSTRASFPETGGPDLTPNGDVDAFIAKVNPSGTALVSCGYIGGSGEDWGNGIAVDSSGNAYVAGTTSSTESTFPVTAGPDLTSNGSGDAFVAKVNASGDVLDYCGYIGGFNIEWGNGIAVDSAGNAYVTGTTVSDNRTFPVRTGPSPAAGGSFDAFVAQVNGDGTIGYCGYIGGTGNDYGRGIAVDGHGAAYVAGSTDSDEGSFPVAAGPDPSQNGSSDAFIAKVNASGAGLDYCGYIGGSGSDLGTAVAVDRNGNAYLAGSTLSTGASFPVTVGPDLTFNDDSGEQDGFVAKVNVSGAGLVYCGYIGGYSNDRVAGIGVDGTGNAYVTGETLSSRESFPVFRGPDLSYNGEGYTDAFVARVNASGSGLDYCGYIGGRLDDGGSGIAVTPDGTPYVTGWTVSAAKTFPEFTGPDLSGNGGFDAFVAKITEGPVVRRIRPASGMQGTTVRITKIAGSNFVTGANVSIVKGNETITAKAVKVASRKKIRCTFLIPADARTGKWGVNVTNPDGQSWVRRKAFLITA